MNMKKIIFSVCFMLLILLPGSGCIKIKHEMTINPIHVTVEIKVKIDRELDNFFADIDEAASSASQEKQQEKSKKGGKK